MTGLIVQSRYLPDSMHISTLNIDEKTVEEKIEEIRSELLGLNKSTFDDFPIESISNRIRAWDECKPFFQVTHILKSLYKELQSHYHPCIVALYSKLLLLHFIRDSLRVLERKSVPRSILRLYYRWFGRILNDFTWQPDEYYNWSHHPFIEELGICCLQIIPTGGAWWIEVSSARKRLLITGGFLQFIDYLLFILLRVGGFKPFYVIHTLFRYAGDFSLEARNRCYLRIAELMRLNSNIKGLYVNGWLYDPKLTSVSPSLGYLRRIPEENGARLFRFGITENAIRNSTAWSPRRRMLYEEGRYIPTEYTLIWPRKAFLNWANKHMRICE